MSTGYGPKIATDGLVFYLNCFDTKTYSESYGSEIVTNTSLTAINDDLSATCFRDASTSTTISASGSATANTLYKAVWMNSAQRGSVSAGIRSGAYNPNFGPNVNTAPNTIKAGMFSQSQNYTLAITGDGAGVDFDMDYLSIKEITTTNPDRLNNLISTNNVYSTFNNSAVFHENSMLFDGSNDYVALSSAINIYQKSYSISAWIKKESSKLQGIMSDLQYAYWALFLNSDNSLSMRHYYSESPYLAHGITTAPNLIGSEWTHVGGTFDVTSGTMKLFVNGKLQAIDQSSSDPGSVLPNGRGPQYIGQYKNSAGNLNTNVFDGKISIVQFYTKAIDENEMYKNYTALLGRFQS